MAILAFDIGGSSIKYALVTDTGSIYEKGRKKTPATLSEFYDTLSEVRRSLGEKHQLEGAAFSFPGAVDDESGEIGGSSALPYIHFFPIRQEIEQRLGLPCAMENDANCAALGEAWLGAGKDFRDMAFFVIGTGVGGAIVLDKKIHRGRHLHGGEFGYMLLGDNYEILSLTGSTQSVVKHAAAKLHKDASELNGKIIFDLADEGNPIAKEAVTAMYEQLARAIYNIQYSLDPEIFILGGAISERPGFAESVQAHIDHILKEVEVAHVRPVVRVAQFGNDANLLGAVRHFLNKFPSKQ